MNLCSNFSFVHHLAYLLLLGKAISWKTEWKITPPVPEEWILHAGKCRGTGWVRGAVWKSSAAVPAVYGVVPRPAENFCYAVLLKIGEFWFTDLKKKKKVAEGTPLSQINSLSWNSGSEQFIAANINVPSSKAAQKRWIFAFICLRNPKKKKKKG